MTRMKWIAGAMIAGLMLSGTGFAYAAVTEPVHKGHHQLTDEQKQAIKDAGVDLKVLKDGHQQIRQSFKALHEKGEALKQAVQNTTDEELKKQLKADIYDIHAGLDKVHALHKANKDLRHELKAAVEAKDSAKIKEAYEKMLENQKQELALIEQANKALDAELAKVKK
ncbi:hypothetical protein OS242_11390 [Tumebacillus sp. DT12]|uniref:Uncharacterized protein n=1 Tax=Tumebacillus lacus TaxID=2995335 RepID=A0ABT3X3L0_9BACL|nr:hypothetical protein [Tumebacillus lacus]MCX7570567.1 hypothetical protein [Tumebacillus lacus]